MRRATEILPSSTHGKKRRNRKGEMELPELMRSNIMLHASPTSHCLFVSTRYSNHDYNMAACGTSYHDDNPLPMPSHPLSATLSPSPPISSTHSILSSSLTKKSCSSSNNFVSAPIWSGYRLMLCQCVNALNACSSGSASSTSASTSLPASQSSRSSGRQCRYTAVMTRILPCRHLRPQYGTWFLKSLSV